MRKQRQDKTGRSFTSVSVDIDTYTKLAETARTEERSISWVIKRIVRDYATKKEISQSG